MTAGLDDRFLAPLLLINAAIALLFATGLLVCLPSHAKRFLWVKRRWLDYWTSLLLIIVLILLPLNLLLAFIHAWLIPLPLAVEAVTVLFTHPADMDVIGANYLTWYTRQGGNEDSARGIAIVLWYAWPLLAAGGVILLFVGLRALKRFYVRLADELEADLVTAQWEGLFDTSLRDAESKHRRRPHHHRHHHHRHRHRHYRGNTAAE
jgi:hypothetical protein